MHKNKIASFHGKYRFLSNFYPCKIWMDEQMYTSVEHAYQAAKTVIPIERDRIRQALYPGQAKRLAKQVTLRPNWEELKIELMRALLLQKFGDLTLRQKLLATGDALLIEGNTWGDTFWGICNDKGANVLGKLLMEVREHYQSPHMD